LHAFDPALQLTDIINGYKSGEFKEFEFHDHDVSRLPNIELSKIQALSSSVAQRLVDQLDASPSRVSSLSDGTHDNIGLLITGLSSGAHFELLLCRGGDLATRKTGCDKQSIYLSAIGRSIE
jgi:hypothetical protein